MTSIVIVRSNHPLDGSQLANAAGIIPGNSLQLTAASALAWVIDNIDQAAFAELASSLRSIFTGADVLAVTVGATTPPAAPAAAAQPYDTLLHSSNVGSIAQ
jgi:hypothetical protein